MTFTVQSEKSIVVSWFLRTSFIWHVLVNVLLGIVHAYMQELGVHSEDLGYVKMGIYSPFWMVNKTGLNLEYKVTLFLHCL